MNTIQILFLALCALGFNQALSMGHVIRKSSKVPSTAKEQLLADIRVAKEYCKDPEASLYYSSDDSVDDFLQLWVTMTRNVAYSELQKSLEKFIAAPTEIAWLTILQAHSYELQLDGEPYDLSLDQSIRQRLLHAFEPLFEGHNLFCLAPSDPADHQWELINIKTLMSLAALCALMLLTDERYLDSGMNEF